MNRRDFLKIPLEEDMPPEPAAAKPEIPIVTRPEAGYPRDYARHSLVLVENARAWLGRDELGFYAVDAICPHLGSVVRPVEKGFICPCHGSVFSTSGVPTAGPARHALRYLMVDLDSDGKLIIRRDHRVTPDDRFIA
jgi:Rieske Fe-S protein